MMDTSQLLRGKSPVIIASWGYLFTLRLYLIFKIFFKDRWWWLGFLNSFTVYWFLPLLLVIPVAISRRNRRLQVICGLNTLVFLYLFGGLLLPKGTAPAARPSLTVMTYNLYVGNHNWPAIRQTILEGNADIVALQELNDDVAARIQTELASAYPYQVVGSLDSVLSRYPITLTDQTLPGRWGSPPQIYLLDVAGQPVTLVNAHFFASAPTLNPSAMQGVFRERENQAQQMADFASEIDTPLIVTADLNATDQSRAYRLVAHQLHDAWPEAGWGFGHTFPGGAIPNLPRPGLAGTYWPSWLARIDYVFFSDDWGAVNARLGEWDGVSDHRPVIAALTLR